MLHGGTLANPPSKAGIEGFAKGLSQIASVADATARAALVSGLTVTPANPVWVYRQDTGNVEMTTNGTTWKLWDPAKVFAGGEANHIGSAATAGQKITEKAWIIDATAAGGGGGVIFSFPTVFAGITNVQYSCMTQNTRLSYWLLGGNQLFCTATTLTGSYVADGSTVTASIRVTGWL